MTVLTIGKAGPAHTALQNHSNMPFIFVSYPESGIGIISRSPDKKRERKGKQDESRFDRMRSDEDAVEGGVGWVEDRSPLLLFFCSVSLSRLSPRSVRSNQLYLVLCIDYWSKVFWELKS